MSNPRSWEVLEPELGKLCYDSKISNRIPILTELKEIVKTNNLSREQLLNLASVLLNTYTIYKDHESKKAVCDIYDEMITIDGSFIAIFWITLLRL